MYSRVLIAQLRHVSLRWYIQYAIKCVWASYGMIAKIFGMCIFESTDGVSGKKGLKSRWGGRKGMNALKSHLQGGLECKHKKNIGVFTGMCEWECVKVPKFVGSENASYCSEVSSEVSMTELKHILLKSGT